MVGGWGHHTFWYHFFCVFYGTLRGSVGQTVSFSQVHLQNATQNITFQNLKVKLQLLQFEQPGLNQ